MHLTFSLRSSKLISLSVLSFPLSCCANKIYIREFNRLQKTELDLYLRRNVKYMYIKTMKLNRTEHCLLFRSIYCRLSSLASQLLLDLVQALALGLGHKEEYKEDTECGEASKKPESAARSHAFI